MAALLQWFLFVVFMGAALTKLAGYDRFLRALVSLPWLGPPNARRAARGIPLLELVLAALLLSVPRIGSLVALLTLVVFTTVVGTELAAGRDFRCSCFGGAGGQSAGKSTLLRNALLGAAAAWLLVLPPSSEAGAMLVGLALGLMFLLIEIGAETMKLERSP